MTIKEQPQVNAESKAKVQAAYKKLVSLQKKILETDQGYKILVLIGQANAASIDLWKTIATVSKNVNPSLMNDINQRPDDFSRIGENDICWMDKNWEILESNIRCSHCGGVHRREDTAK